ncbi:hypothetical protein L345_06466, partial [Ophiophagus hannah]
MQRGQMVSLQHWISNLATLSQQPDDERSKVQPLPSHHGGGHQQLPLMVLSGEVVHRTDLRWGGLCSIQLSLKPNCQSLLLMLSPPCFTVGRYWAGDEWCLVLFCKKRAFSAIKPRSVEGCSNGCPSGTLSHLHTRSLELSQRTIGFLVISLTKALLSSCSVWPGNQLLKSPDCTKPEILLQPSPDLCLAIILSLSSAGSSFDLMQGCQTCGPQARCVTCWPHPPTRLSEGGKSPDTSCDTLSLTPLERKARRERERQEEENQQLLVQALSSTIIHISEAKTHLPLGLLLPSPILSSQLTTFASECSSRAAAGEGRKEGRKEGKEGRREGRKEGEEGREGGRKEGRFGFFYM